MDGLGGKPALKFETPVVKKPDIKSAAYVPVKSMDEAKQRITDLLGVKDINLGRMKPELANQYVEGIHDFMQDHPKLKGFIDKIDTKVGGNEGLFEISGSRDANKNLNLFTRLGLRNPQDYQKFMEGIQKQIDIEHFFDGDNPKALAIHELTHAVDYMAGMTRKGTCVNGKIVQGLSGSINSVCPTLSHEVIEAAKKKVFGETYGTKSYEGMKYLGRYSMTNSAETLAQAIAYEYTGRSNIFSKTAKEIFELKVKEVLK
jgi:hypothetical protein